MEQVKSISDGISNNNDNQESCSRGADFGFAFNNTTFSDRVLTIEIIPDLVESSKLDDQDSSITTDLALNRNRKRRREDFTNENDDVACENLDGEAVAIIEESHLMDGNEVDNSLPGSPGVIRVMTLHITSAILAAQSPFFYKLFSNGMRESEQQEVTLRFHASEEAALMGLLNFIYSGTLEANTPADLLDVLMAADKFEVASCMRCCSNMLGKFTMTLESALVYLDLSSGVLMAEAVKPLLDEAKKFLALKFKDISKYQEEVMNLPLAAFEAILSSDQLQVDSEDAIFDLAVKWVRTHYSTVEERQKILGTRLCRHLRFPHMTCGKLKKVQTCSDIKPEHASTLVMDALFFKANPALRQRVMLSPISFHYVERAYKYRPIKVIEFETPRKHCIVYLDLNKEECQNLYPSGHVLSQDFHLSGQDFLLLASCSTMDQQSSYQCFGLSLATRKKSSVSFPAEYEFAARQKVVTQVVAGQPNVTDDYVSKYKGNHNFMEGKVSGCRNLFGLQWNSFIADDSPFFVNGVLHIRAEVTIRP